jgi:hypothetical protein
VTLNLACVAKRRAIKRLWQEADFLESWAAELRESGDMDLANEAERMDRDADIYRQGARA